MRFHHGTDGFVQVIGTTDAIEKIGTASRDLLRALNISNAFFLIENTIEKKI